MLFDRFFDDASLFPPAETPFPEAVLAHRDHRVSWYRGLVGPFVCPVERAGEIPRELRDQLTVSLLVAPGSGPLDLSGITIQAVETAARAPQDLEVALRALEAYVDAGAEGYVEILPAHAAAVAGKLARSGYRAKLRTGGASVPADEEVLAFFSACMEHDVSFKCTAGLHHAVRTDAEGVQHGFLNLLGAIDALLVSGGVEAASWIGDTSAGRVAEGVRELPAARVRAVRQWFGSIGTCSITEPLEDLTALGFLTRP